MFQELKLDFRSGRDAALDEAASREGLGAVASKRRRRCSIQRHSSRCGAELGRDGIFAYA